MAEAIGSRTEEELRRVFRHWDIDKDGSISEADFTRVLLQLGVPSDTAPFLFAKVNISRDGHLKYDEFSTWVSSEDEDARNIRQRVGASRIFRESARLRGETSVDPDILVSVGNISVEELDQIAALRRLRVPPEIVRRTVEALCMILNASRQPKPTAPPIWITMQRILGDAGFVSRVQDFDVGSLRASPALCDYLTANYFGLGGARKDELLGGNRHPLTFARVSRASHSLGGLFKWCTMELVSVGAMEPPQYEQILDDNVIEEIPMLEETAQEIETVETTENVETDNPPELTGFLAKLPSREHVVEPHRVLFLAMTGCGDEAVALAESKKKCGPCNKCDGPHHEDECPYFSGTRAEWEEWAEGEGVLGAATESSDDSKSKHPILIGHVVQQPGDGSCLYHSLAHCIGTGQSGLQLRRAIAEYLATHAEDEVAGKTFKEFIWWEHGLSAHNYAKTMAGTGLWGGAIEIAAFIRMFDAKVHVFEPHRGKFKRICCFGDDPSKTVCTIVYTGRCHYDALRVE